MERQFVSFEIGENKYCIDIMDVKEVVRETNITKMPDTPFFVEGIMNLRGIVIPVISVKKKLNLPDEVVQVSDDASKKQKKQKQKLIIVSIDGVLIGFLVDNLDRVFAIDESQIQSSDKMSDGSIDKAMVHGVAKIEEKVYLILDIKRLLDFEEKSFIQKEIIE